MIPVLDFGGVETTLEIQAKHIDRNAFDFRVCTFWKPGSAAESIEKSGSRVDVLGVDPAVRNPKATAVLLRYLRETKPDIVHSSIGEANFHAALVGRIAGAKVVIEEQGVPSRRVLSRMVHAGLYRLTDRIIAVSDASADYMIRREFAPRGKLFVLPNAAREEFFEVPLPDREPGQVRIVSVGRLVAVKNHELLLRAFARVQPNFPNAELLIVGDGELRSRLQQVVSELGLSGKASLVGFSPDVRSLLDRSDIFVIPSHSEGFGIALVEAMARGCMVISSTAGALPRLMADLAEKWAVPATDERAWASALAAALKLSPSERAALGSQARTLARPYSPRAHVAALEGFYHTLLAA